MPLYDCGKGEITHTGWSFSHTHCHSGPSPERARVGAGRESAIGSGHLGRQIGTEAGSGLHQEAAG